MLSAIEVSENREKGKWSNFIHTILFLQPKTTIVIPLKKPLSWSWANNAILRDTSRPILNLGCDVFNPDPMVEKTWAPATRLEFHQQVAACRHLLNMLSIIAVEPECHYQLWIQTPRRSLWRLLKNRSEESKYEIKRKSQMSRTAISCVFFSLLEFNISSASTVKINNT